MVEREEGRRSDANKWSTGDVGTILAGNWVKRKEKKERG